MKHRASLQQPRSNRYAVALPILAICLVLPFYFWSCAGVKPVQQQPRGSTADRGTELKQDLSAVHKELTEANTVAKQLTKQGEAATAKKQVTPQPVWTGLTQQQAKTDANLSQLGKIKEQDVTALIKSAKEWEAYGKARAAAEAREKARAEKAEASLNDALRKQLNWLVVVSVVGVALSGALVFAGNRIGIATGVGSAILGGAALLVGQSLPWLPYALGGLALVVVGVVVYLLISRRKLDAAAGELVKTIEVTKELMPKRTRAKLFGDVLPVASEVQSHSTKKVVRAKRQALDKLAPSLQSEPLAPTVEA